METIDLMLDESNELVFKVVVEGTKESDASVRFVIKDNDMAFSFPATNLGQGEVQVDLPVMKKKLTEGVYDASLEVIVEDRFFEPLAFKVDMQNGVEVSAASVVQINENKRRKRKKPVTVGASASIITAKRKSGKTSIREAAKSLEPINEKVENKEEKPDKKLTEENIRAVLQDLIRKGNLEL